MKQSLRDVTSHQGSKDIPRLKGEGLLLCLQERDSWIQCTSSHQQSVLDWNISRAVLRLMRVLPSEWKAKFVILLSMLNKKQYYFALSPVYFATPSAV
jgi:hypothetical protein